MARQGFYTTKQIAEAPTGATYVWCNGNPTYVRELAAYIGRHDIRFVPKNALNDNGTMLRGTDREIVIDHAAELTHAERETVGLLRQLGYRIIEWAA